MAHHAYVYAGELEAGIEAAIRYGKESLGLVPEGNPDVIVFRFGLFSVDDARRVIRLAEQAALGERKLIVIAAERLFHEAQNALLKLFEEPPHDTTLVLVVPSLGMLLATLRSRVLSLPGGKHDSELVDTVSNEAQVFLAANASAREKLVAKLLDRAKSDRDEEKQAARGEALRLAEGLEQAAYEKWKRGDREAERFARDLDRFIPILHERSAPLKLIFEHILLTVPKF